MTDLVARYAHANSVLSIGSLLRLKLLMSERRHGVSYCSILEANVL